MEKHEYQLFCCGSRGSRPVQGRKFIEFGGYTSCYVLKTYDYALIIDCGTGLYEANAIVGDCSTIDVVMTHIHYDHILGILNWTAIPQYSKVTFYSSFSEWFGEKTMKEFFRKPFWPVQPEFNLQEVAADGHRLKLRDDLSVEFYPAAHPNGGRLIVIRQNSGETEETENKLIVMFDCEFSDALPSEIVHNSNILIYDGMFSDEEYPKFAGYGHSTYQEGCRLANRESCNRLIITHHDPSKTDSELRAYERNAREIHQNTDFARAGQRWDFPCKTNVVPVQKEEKKPSQKNDKSIPGFFNSLVKKVHDYLDILVLDDVRMDRMLTAGTITVLGVVSLFMTIVNIFTGMYLLMASTAVFAALCLINIIILLINKKSLYIIKTISEIEMIVLITFFIISGTPEGFSIIWALLIPAGGMLVFGRKRATIMCIITLIIFIICFDTSFGQNLLMYDYNDSFRLRFPMAFIAFSVVAFFLETLRQHSQDHIKKLQREQEEVIADQTMELRDQNFELQNVNSQLELRNRLLNKTFGKFLPDEVVHEYLNDSNGGISSAKAYVTVLQSDIRGFTPISSRMEAMDLVNMLNHYLGIMTEIIQNNGGTVIEFMGDAILAVFGIQENSANHADRAVAAAIQMQKTMKSINDWNFAHGYEWLEMGIGLHSGDVVIGLIGSDKRLKYDTIGTTVNVCSRIQTYCVGGQILVTEEVLNNLKNPIHIDGTVEAAPKGIDHIVTLSSVDAISGEFNVSCPQARYDFEPLKKPLPVDFVCIEDVHCDFHTHTGTITHVSKIGAIIETDGSLRLYDNIKISYSTGVLCKITDKNGTSFTLRYTSLPKGFDNFGEPDFKNN